MIVIFDLLIIATSIFVLYNVLKDKSKDRDNHIKIGMLLLFFLIILKLII